MRSFSAQALIRKFITPDPWPNDSFQLPKFQSHRGYWREGALENSLESLRKAHRQGFQMAEIDVQLTSDQIPVLFHDENLTRLARRPEKIREISLAELQKILPVPSLEQVLRAAARPPFLNIELKTKIIFNEPLERRVTEVIRRTQSQNKILFSSFNPFSIYRISQYLPEVPRALLVSPESTPENSWILRSMAMAPLLKISALHFEKSALNPEEVNYWRAKGMPVSVWTLREPEEISEFDSWGVSSQIIDLPLPTLGPV